MLGPVTTATIDVTGAVTPIVEAAVGKLAWKEPVRAKTAGALPANTYSNGASGVGATLTATANGALAAVDGVTLAPNDRVLVDQEATGSHNGIYVVTQLGDAGSPYILTRAEDADEGALGERSVELARARRVVRGNQKIRQDRDGQKFVLIEEARPVRDRAAFLLRMMRFMRVNPLF